MEGQSEVAGYYRVSRARDGMKAPELYECEIEAYCQYKGYCLTRIFSDLDISGWKLGRRPGLEELIYRRKEFSIVVVPKLARFGRSVRHLSELFDVFDRDGIALVFLDMNVDTSTSQGRLLRNVMAAFAEYESDVRSDYSKASARYRASQGKPNGTPPFGYAGRSGKWRVEPDSSAVVRRIHESYLAGGNLRSITLALNAEGVPARGGAQWRRASVRNVLDNPSYAGLRPFDGTLIRGTWKPIIDPEAWLEVHRLRGRQKERHRRTRQSDEVKYLLSALIHCGQCGRRLHHRTKQDRSPGQYVCRGDRETGFCHGGGIADHRAEAFVTDAYLARYGDLFVRSADGTAPRALYEEWAVATTDRRRQWLSAAIARLELTPRPLDNRRGKGLPRGRVLQLVWVDQVPGRFGTPPSAPREPTSSASERASRYFAEWGAFRRRLVRNR